MARAPYHRVRALSAIAEHMEKNIKARGDNATALNMLALTNRLALGATALDNVRASRNPLDTPEAHALKVAKLAKKYDSEAAEAINRFGSIVHAHNQDLQSRIDQKINLKPDAFASEIRSAFRTLSRQEKVKLLGELVEGNRGPELAAIVKAPAVLTGISELEQSNFEKAIISRHAPAELEERQWIDELFENCMTVVNQSFAVARDFVDPSELQRIESAEAASNAAGEAFSASLQ